MNPIQNFAFEEHLVRVVDRDGEPWFVGKDVCGALGIKNHNDALSNLDLDEKGVASTDPLTSSARGGGAQEVVIVSEPGVYRLVFRSRKPEAERFKRWLAHDVLPQIRRTGRYERRDAAGQPVPAPEDREGRALRMVTEARMIFGKAAAARLWAELGLPPVPAALPDTEPEQCLDHLLEWQIEAGVVGELLRAALAGDEEAAAALLDAGLRLGEGCFTVANAHPAILRCYRGTRWRQPYRYLRRLEGAIEAKPMRYGRNIVARGVELPAFYADDETLH